MLLLSSPRISSDYCIYSLKCHTIVLYILCVFWVNWGDRCRAPDIATYVAEYFYVVILIDRNDQVRLHHATTVANYHYYHYGFGTTDEYEIFSCYYYHPLEYHQVRYGPQPQHSLHSPHLGYHHSLHTHNNNNINLSIYNNNKSRGIHIILVGFLGRRKHQQIKHR